MATNDVISALVRDLRPVEPLPLPRVRLSRWAAATGLSTLAAVGVLGLRADLSSVATTTTFQIHALLLLVAALGSGAVALASSIPGDPTSPWRRVAPLVAIVGWWLWLGAEVWSMAMASGAWWPVAAGWGCVAKAVAVGFVPGGVLAAMISKAAPPDLRRTCVFAGLASAAVGALGVELTCPLNNPTHLLLWHAGPVIFTMIAVTLIATVVARGLDGLRIWR